MVCAMLAFTLISMQQHGSLCTFLNGYASVCYLRVHMQTDMTNELSCRYVVRLQHHRVKLSSFLKSTTSLVFSCGVGSMSRVGRHTSLEARPMLLLLL